MNAIALGRKLEAAIKAVELSTINLETLKSRHEGVVDRLEHLESLLKSIDERQIELIEHIKKSMTGRGVK